MHPLYHRCRCHFHQSIIKWTLHEEHSTFSALTSAPIEGFSWKSVCRTQRKIITKM
jgi:hypothetical protein